MFSQKTFLHGKDNVLFSDDIKHICQAFLFAEQIGNESKLLANFDWLGMVSGNVTKQYGGSRVSTRDFCARFLHVCLLLSEISRQTNSMYLFVTD